MGNSIYSSQKFNLIPPKSKEEVVIVEERDNSLYYSFILIFFGMVVFFFVILADVLVVKPREASLKAAIESKARDISSYDAIRRLHGELFTKSRALDPILDQDIKLTQLLTISQDLIKNIDNSRIISYSREQTGNFVLALKLNDFESIEGVINNSKGIGVLEEMYIKDLVKTESSDGVITYTATVSFKINNIKGKDA